MRHRRDGAINLRWWGKLLGSCLGFMFGGPVGAVLGAVLGHNFDLAVRWLMTSQMGREKREVVSRAFFTATFQVMGYLAKADGRVSENQINAAQAVMTHLQLTPTQRQAAIRLFNEGKQGDFLLELALSQFREACQERTDLVRKFMEIQFSVLYADGIPHPRERTVLLDIANQLGFSRLLFDTMDAFIRSRLRYQNTGRGAGQKTGNRRAAAVRELPLHQAYATLGLTHRATNDEVKRAYRRLLNRHHPDKVVARDASAEALAQATDKTREVKAAYERIKIARGL